MRNFFFSLAVEHVDYDLTDVILGKEYLQQGDKFYAISAVFTDYLMDTYGLNKFKELFRHESNDLLSGFEKTCGKPLSGILEEYKKWLMYKSVNQVSQ